MSGSSIDYCTGCETPYSQRVNLPEDWEPGDPSPKNLTVHYTRQKRAFAFVGDPWKQVRHYLDNAIFSNCQ